MRLGDWITAVGVFVIVAVFTFVLLTVLAGAL